MNKFIYFGRTESSVTRILRPHCIAKCSQGNFSKTQHRNSILWNFIYGPESATHYTTSNRTVRKASSELADDNDHGPNPKLCPTCYLLRYTINYSIAPGQSDGPSSNKACDVAVQFNDGTDVHPPHLANELTYPSVYPFPWLSQTNQSALNIPARLLLQTMR